MRCLPCMNWFKVKLLHLKVCGINSQTSYQMLIFILSSFQEFHDMDPEIMLRSLSILVKRGKAQIFGSDGQEGVKFF